MQFILDRHTELFLFGLLGYNAYDLYVLYFKINTNTDNINLIDLYIKRRKSWNYVKLNLK